MRTYVAGPMTGYPDLNRPAFDAAENRLMEQGHFVINPVNISVTFGEAEELAESFRRYYDVLDVCGEDYFEKGAPAKKVEVKSRVARAVIDAELAAVRSCDAIYLLRGWETSRGARKELSEAIAHGLKIVLAEEYEREQERQDLVSKIQLGRMIKEQHDAAKKEPKV